MAEIRIFESGQPSFLLVQMSDEDDLRGFDEEADYLRAHAARGFTLAAIPVNDWFADLSPWQAPPVFGKVPFGGGAAKTLEKLTDTVIPELKLRHGYEKTVIGGYSLSALFALWGGYNYEGFYGVAAASPSVWFEGWDEYIASARMKCDNVYLSIGDREERAKNKVMARVGERIRLTYDVLLSQGVSVKLEYNEGNHFKDAAVRTAKAFADIMCRADD